VLPICAYLFSLLQVDALSVVSFNLERKHNACFSNRSWLAAREPATRFEIDGILMFVWCCGLVHHVLQCPAPKETETCVDAGACRVRMGPQPVDALNVLTFSWERNINECFSHRSGVVTHRRTLMFEIFDVWMSCFCCCRMMYQIWQRPIQKEKQTCVFEVGVFLVRTIP
jgi:hypothetical protein